MFFGGLSVLRSARNFWIILWNVIQLDSQTCLIVHFFVKTQNKYELHKYLENIYEYIRRASTTYRFNYVQSVYNLQDNLGLIIFLRTQANLLVDIFPEIKPYIKAAAFQ